MDAARLERLYRDHGPAVLRRARQMLQDDEAARDALQEILSLADHHSFDLRSGATAWFYTRTTNYCLNRLRDERNRARLRRERGERMPTTAPPRGENLAVAREALAGLPAELAEVAVYYYCDEMTHDEIAALLGCSRRHIGNLIERLHVNLEATACG